MNKLNAITSAITMSFAALMPNNAQANDEAKRLLGNFMPSNRQANERAKEILRKLIRTNPQAFPNAQTLLEELEAQVFPNVKDLLEKLKRAGKESLSVWTEEMEEAVEDAMTFFKAKTAPEGHVENLVFQDWPKDADESDLLMHMMTIPDLELGLIVKEGSSMPDAFWKLNLCNLRGLDIVHGDVPDDFLRKLKTNQTIQQLAIPVSRQSQLDALADALSADEINGNKLEIIRLVNTSLRSAFLDTTSIAKALLTKPYLARLELCGNFEVLPLFTTCDEVRLTDSCVVERIPQLATLDLVYCKMPQDSVTRLTRASKIFLPSELVVFWTSVRGRDNPWREFTKLLMERGEGPETALGIKCRNICDEQIQTLIEIVRKNSRKLSWLKLFGVSDIRVSKNLEDLLDKELEKSEIPGEFESQFFEPEMLH